MLGDPISGKTRTEFREYFFGTTLAEIDDAFRAEGIQSDLAFGPPVGGQRRTLVEQYYHTIDWRDPSDVGQMLRVYEAVLVSLDLCAAFERPQVRMGWWHCDRLAQVAFPGRDYREKEEACTLDHSEQLVQLSGPQ